MINYKKRLYFVLIILFLPVFYGKNIHGMDDEHKKKVSQYLSNDYSNINDNNPEKVKEYIGKQFGIFIDTLDASNETLCKVDDFLTEQDTKNAIIRIREMQISNNRIKCRHRFDRKRFLSKKTEGTVMTVAGLLSGIYFLNDIVIFPAVYCLCMLYKAITINQAESSKSESFYHNCIKIDEILNNAKTILDTNSEKS